MELTPIQQNAARIIVSSHSGQGLQADLYPHDLLSGVLETYHCPDLSPGEEHTAAREAADHWRVALARTSLSPTTTFGLETGPYRTLGNTPHVCTRTEAFPLGTDAYPFLPETDAQLAFYIITVPLPPRMLCVHDTSVRWISSHESLTSILLHFGPFVGRLIDLHKQTGVAMSSVKKLFADCPPYFEKDGLVLYPQSALEVIAKYKAAQEARHASGEATTAYKNASGDEKSDRRLKLLYVQMRAEEARRALTEEMKSYEAGDPLHGWDHLALPNAHGIDADTHEDIVFL